MYKNGLLNYDFFDETDSDIIENDDDEVYLDERSRRKNSVLVAAERVDNFDNGIVDKAINDDNVDNSTKVNVGKIEEFSDSDVKTDVRKVKAKKEKNEQKDNSEETNTVIKKSIASLTSSDSSDEIIDEESTIERKIKHNNKSDKKICNIIPLKSTTPRTIFSKMSDKILKSVQNGKNAPFSYEDFVNDTQLITLSKQYNNSNSNIIRSFIARSTSPSEDKKRHDYQPYRKPIVKAASRSTEKFLKDQSMYAEKKEKRLIKIAEEVKKDIEIMMTEKPLISERSNEMVMRKRRKEMPQGDIHERLYNERRNKEKKDILDSFSEYYNKAVSSSPMKKKTKGIKINDKLYERLMKIKSKDTNEERTTTRINQRMTSKGSNYIIFDKFISKYENVMINQNRLLSEEISIDYNLFITVLKSLAFIKDKNDDRLVSELYKEISSSLTSFSLIVYLLTIIGIDVSSEEIVNRLKRLRCYPEKEITVLTSIKKDYYPLSVNYYDNDIKDRRKEQKKAVSSPKRKKKKIRANFVIRQRDTTSKKIMLLEEKKRIDEAKMKECTFHPNLSLTKKRNHSSDNKSKIDFSNRLYIDALKKINKAKQIELQKSTAIEPQSNHIPHFTRLNNEMFTVDPMENDRHYISRKRTLTENRIEKEKIAKYLTYGWTSPSSEKNLDVNIKRRKIYGDFSFGKENTKKMINDTSFEVDIEMSNEILKLIVHKNDDILQKVKAFSRNHNINEDASNQIMNEVLNNVSKYRYKYHNTNI